MAKGDPSGRYQAEPFAEAPSDTAALVAWIARELQKISYSFELGVVGNVDFLNVAPDKPREGNIVGADGTNWNPGSGKGVYCYYSGAWHFLG